MTQVIKLKAPNLKKFKVQFTIHQNYENQIEKHNNTINLN